MKQVTLETVKIKLPNGKEEEVKDEAIIFTATRGTEKEQRGYTFAQYQQFKRIDDKLATIKDNVVSFEDGDFEFVLSKLKSNRWGIASKEAVKQVLHLVDKFEEAKKKQS